MFNVAEEFPSIRAGRALLLLGVSTAILIAVIGGYVLWNRVPPAAEGQILAVRVYRPNPPAADSARGAEVSAVTDADAKLLVLVPVQIRNVGRKPVRVFDLSAVLGLGKLEYRSFDVSGADYPLVFRYYPDLAPLADQPPVLRRSVIGPGRTLTGLLIFNYPVSLDQWDRRRSFDVRVSFDHAKDLVLRSIVPQVLATNSSE